MIDLERDLRALSGNKSFANFLITIRQMRENSIILLHGAETSDVQQIAGSIVAFNEILQMCDIDRVVKNTENIPD
jgi:hypothetical protein